MIGLVLPLFYRINVYQVVSIMADIDSEDENDTEMELEQKSAKITGVQLELGDIISITAPRNEEINEETYFITYLDKDQIKLTNVATFQPYILRLNQDGSITDESITIIDLLSRSDEQGYARQHMLLPKTWVDIHFGGDVPATITGEITNLEEDMIEVTMYPSLETIYIDFEYKGIPIDIPIQSIVIRTKPNDLGKISSLTNILEEGEERDLADGQGVQSSDDIEEASIEFTDSGESIIKLPTDVLPDPHIREVLHGLYLAADDIVFGEDLGDIAQVVEVSESQRRYGIETQVNDMMDELLSDIPNSRRTEAVLANIHLLINRFKELRREFSTFDGNGNISEAKTFGPTHIPIVDRIAHLQSSLKWIIPVVALKRKLYDSDLEKEAIVDVSPSNTLADMSQLEAIQTEYKENRGQGDEPRYIREAQRQNPLLLPFEPPQSAEQYLLPGASVNDNIEGIISTMEDFYSTVVYGANAARRRFVIQRYNLGANYLTKPPGRQTNQLVKLTPNDQMTMKSLVLMPESVVRYSQVSLPGSSIMTKSALAQRGLYLFRLFRKNTELYQHVIDDLDKELDYEKWEGETKMKFLSIMQEYVLDESLLNEPDRFRRFLRVIMPATRVLIRLVKKYIRNKLSFFEVSQTLEPFMIYGKDITYGQYMEIRHFIKGRIQEFKKLYAEQGQKFTFLRNTTYDVVELQQRFERMIFEKRDMLENIVDLYRLGKDKKHSASEWLSKVLRADQGRTFSTLVQFMMVTLITPENLLNALLEKDGDSSAGEGDEMSKSERLLAKDCARRVLAKRYHKIGDMQKDNGSAEVFFDKEFDETPYELMKLYKSDQQRLLPTEFVDFLAENLIVKHGYPEEAAKEVAVTLIAGKKAVVEGQYAIAELRPRLAEGVDTSKMSERELKEMESESEIKKKIQYYRRVKMHWVHDANVGDETFIDNNTLFCNMAGMSTKGRADGRCAKNETTAVCESEKTAEERMRDIARKRTLGEFDKRYDASVDGLKQGLENKIKETVRLLQKMQMLQDIQLSRANDVAHQLGKFASADLPAQSPYISLVNLVLGQTDFIKRQFDIIRLVTKFGRDPMVDELSEDMYWVYCKETNTKLIPRFLLELASEYTSEGNYLQKLDELCRKQGAMSDDGDAIVDRYSGFVIRKIDFADEEGFDEAGFRLVTHEVMEKDAGAAMMDVLGKRKDRVFENETAEMVFRVYAALATNIGIPLDSVEDFVIRVSSELIAKNVMSQEAYEKRATKMEKEKGKRPVNYDIYRNQTLLAIVSAVLLLAIQTATPSFRLRKTFPGCILSFDGYPMSDNDTTGLQYIACVLNKTKSSIAPWNAIEKLSATTLQARIREILEKYIVTRADLMELYVQKREYLAIHPDVDSVPKEHRLERWTHFLPPVVAFSIVKSLRGLSKEFKDELFQQMRQGTRTQRDLIGTATSKVTQYGYGLVEAINTIVSKKDLLLKTASKVLFMENACCNELATKRPLDYFAAEDRNIELYDQITSKWALVLASIREQTRAPMFYHDVFTGIQYPPVPTEHFEENVYLAYIHYCNFDNARPIPEDLRPLCAEKVPGYDPRATLVEKMEFLKRNGKRYTLASLNHLMEIVNRRNLAGVVQRPAVVSPVSATEDFLQYLDNKESTVIERPIREHLSAVLRQYDATKMRNEDTEEMMRLKNYVTRANGEMFTYICNFLEKHGNLSTREYGKVVDFIENVCTMTDREKSDATYSSFQFIKNSVYTMTKVFPEIIYNDHGERQAPPKHWGLSSKQHVIDVKQFMKKYYEPLQKFKHDSILSRLLAEIRLSLVDLHILIQEIPIPATIRKEDTTFYALYDTRTACMLMTYGWYSVLYEYMRATDNEDLLRADVQVAKGARRETIAKRRNTMEPAESVDIFESDSDDEGGLEEIQDDLAEVQIDMGNVAELKDRVASLVLAFLSMEMESKKTVDLSYEDISKNMRRSRQQEKKMITDFLRDMDSDERKTEDLKKLYKLGRWGVGMQKGLVKYDAGTYERERGELIARLAGEGGEGGEGGEDGIMMVREVGDLDRDAEADADAEGEAEAGEFEDLDEDYMDGHHYGEDAVDDAF